MPTQLYRQARNPPLGAYDTYTYSVDYPPPEGGEPVTDHRWVVQEEIEDAGDEQLADGSEVTLLADHMRGHGRRHRDDRLLHRRDRLRR